MRLYLQFLIICFVCLFNFMTSFTSFMFHIFFCFVYHQGGVHSSIFFGTTYNCLPPWTLYHLSSVMLYHHHELSVVSQILHPLLPSIKWIQHTHTHTHNFNQRLHVKCEWIKKNKSLVASNKNNIDMGLGWIWPQRVAQ